jgi:uncharacterized membrane protein YhfC
LNNLEITIPIQIVLQFAVPVLAGWLVVRRYGQETPDPLRIFLGGAVAFAAAQFLLLALAQGVSMLSLPAVPEPWSSLVSVAAYAAAMAVIGSLAFYAVLRFWLREARSWADGLMLGIGYGAAESLLTGLFTAVWFVTMESMKTQPAAETITEEEKTRLADALSTYWGTPWHVPLASAIQELLFLVIALGLAALVMQVFLRRNHAFLPAGAGFSFLATATPLALGQLGLGYSLAGTAVFALLALLIVARLRPPALTRTLASAAPSSLPRAPGATPAAPVKRAARKRRTKKP